jgi:hypothetical protein
MIFDSVTSNGATLTSCFNQYLQFGQIAGIRKLPAVLEFKILHTDVLALPES